MWPRLPSKRVEDRGCATCMEKTLHMVCLGSLFPKLVGTITDPRLGKDKQWRFQAFGTEAGPTHRLSLDQLNFRRLHNRSPEKDSQRPNIANDNR